jgi:hypothetical protein
VRFVEIWNNTFRTLNGAGIWAISDGGTCEDNRIHDNIFDTIDSITQPEVFSRTGITDIPMAA